MDQAISQKWPKDRAILFVHGVGNAKPGSYDPLVRQFETILGASANNYAIYFLYYDQVDEWFSQHQQAEPAFSKMVRSIVGLVHDLPEANTASVGEVIAQHVGDIIWPVLLGDARRAVRTKLLQQLQQIRLDGIAANVRPRRQHVSIIAHSMGCFHVYEALTHAALTATEMLGPASAESVFDNVILMASPVQLIRTVAGALGALVPQRESIYTIGRELAIPSEPDGAGKPTRCTPNMVSITGNLDPIGGYFFRHQYAYMHFDGLEPIVDPQQVANVDGSEEISLMNLLNSASQQNGPPNITPENPHDWGSYVSRHATELRKWLA